MEKLNELRMTLIILAIGIFFMSGCLFNNKVTITFKTNGGSEISNITLSSGSIATEPDDPVKEGYVFEGWYLDGEEFDFSSSVDEDITLVAKWTKITIEGATEDNEIDETTETTTTSKSSTKKTTKTTTKANNTTTKKSTTKTTTSTKKNSTTTTSLKTVATTTTTTTTTTSISVSVITVPTITTTTTITEPTTTTTVRNVKLNIQKEDVLDDDNVKISENITLSISENDSNVVSNIDDTDVDIIENSNMREWNIISNHDYIYTFDFSNLSDDEAVTTLQMSGDTDVVSFSLTIAEKSYIFDYDELLNIWYIKYPTVSVGIGLDLHYFADLSTAINVIKSGDTLNILADQIVENELIIKYPIILNGNNYKISNETGYLFNIENITYEDTDELIFNDLVVDVDSLLYVGTSEFTNITFENLSGTIKTNKTDGKENGMFDNTNLLSKLKESLA